MIRYFIFILCFISLSLDAQEEKRLALIIGNANYDKGALKNPVNDAALMKQTLEKLNFEVIYAINVSKKMEMVDKIAEFGKKRKAYDVGFVYYAGHGVQVGGENYLLPTKETFQSQFDVEDYGVSVQKIMRYLKGMSNQVNVLILDACRDNPFESTWNNNRSLKGAGLAKIPPPSGSLIAFSTSANTTANDGTENNSLYCKSLATNLQLENTSIDQVFRNVREDVIDWSNGRQIPEEASKLVGEAYYFSKTESKVLLEKLEKMDVDKLNYLLSASQGDFKSKFNFKSFTDSLILNDTNEFNILIAKNTKILELDSKNICAYKNRGKAYYQMESFDKAMLDFESAVKLDSNDGEISNLMSTILTYQEQQNQLGLEYLEGITEKVYERKNRRGDVIEVTLVRIVVIGKIGNEYRKVKSKWGVSYYKNGSVVSEEIWNNQTQ
ncbi:MAG: caspase family protein [Flavobacteriales bacterium]|nr:caspase family protein [Flavobacteriales bacterium]